MSQSLLEINWTIRAKFPCRKIKCQSHEDGDVALICKRQTRDSSQAEHRRRHRGNSSDAQTPQMQNLLLDLNEIFFSWCSLFARNGRIDNNCGAFTFTASWGLVLSGFTTRSTMQMAQLNHQSWSENCLSNWFTTLLTSLASEMLFTQLINSHVCRFFFSSLSDVHKT